MMHAAGNPRHQTNDWATNPSPCIAEIALKHEDILELVCVLPGRESVAVHKNVCNTRATSGTPASQPAPLPSCVLPKYVPVLHVKTHLMPRGRHASVTDVAAAPSLPIATISHPRPLIQPLLERIFPLYMPLHELSRVRTPAPDVGAPLHTDPESWSAISTIFVKMTPNLSRSASAVSPRVMDARDQHPER